MKNMLYFTDKTYKLYKPNIGVLDLLNEDTRGIVKIDINFLKALFADVRVLDITTLKCDVMFLYAKFTPES